MSTRSAALFLFLGGCAAGASPRSGSDVDAGALECDRAASPEPETCYTGPAETVDVSPCRPGVRACTADGVWGACEGEVLPVEEDSCNGIDDDCDGAVDEDRDDRCGRRCIGPQEGCTPWGEDVSSGIAETPEGWLALDDRSAGTHVIWPSSSAQGTILRVDTRSFEIEGAYYTGSRHDPETPLALRDTPASTAVDDDGNAIVANRNQRSLDGPPASITKIAPSGDGCPDRDDDGVLDTSTAWDDLLPFDAPDAWSDECILWHTQLDGHNAGALAIQTVLALDGVVEQRGWVGLPSAGASFFELDTETGELTGRSARGFDATYSAVIDRDGWLWTTGPAPTCVARFDTAHPENGLEAFDICGPIESASYVAIDEAGEIWIVGRWWVYRWDRDAERLEPVGAGSSEAGTAVYWGGIASDGDGSIFVAGGGDATPFPALRDQFVRRIDAEDLGEHAIETPGTHPWAMAVDFDGQAWAFGSEGNATVIDLDTEDTTLVLDDCGGEPCIDGTWFDGNVTGLQRRIAVDPLGTWTGIVEGCADGATVWERITVDAATPAGTEVRVLARTADALRDLATQTWTTVGVLPRDGGEIDLEGKLEGAGGILAVRVYLVSTDRASTPVLEEVEVQWSCEDAPG